MPTTREELLAHPDVQHIPAAWLADKTDAEIRAYIEDLAARRAADTAADAAVQAERRAWTAPEWLLVFDGEGEAGRRAYRTDDGYTATPGNASGRGRSDRSSGWHLRGPGLRETAHVTTLRRMVETIEWARQQG